METFPAAHFSVIWGVMIFKMFLSLLWSFSDHLEFFWSPDRLKWGDGMMFHQPGMRCCSPRIQLLSQDPAPIVEHPYLPWGSSFCASFMEKDDHRFPAQQCRETHGKPGQSCPKPLLQRVPGFPEEQEELRGLEIQPPSHIPFLMFPSSLLPRKHFCFWTLIRCISVILKNLLFVHSAAVSMFFPCFSLIRKEFK